MTNILFRVDADPTIGLGHLQRCISLAQALESIDVESVFLSYDHLEAITRIQRFGFEV
ncbi:MAG TPA: UDP-2,4-diacetamido-2,4,6-trideoxy-beta-L-altropyranose hydrolase, partial [Chloroflexi bacterium]|nr:UDP-2,4-diacetamido-2,4,6-trideoxy-beta-L-altropyranose hydrolase [Chloroflexota bacterium]